MNKDNSQEPRWWEKEMDERKIWSEATYPELVSFIAEVEEEAVAREFIPDRGDTKHVFMGDREYTWKCVEVKPKLEEK